MNYFIFYWFTKGKDDGNGNANLTVETPIKSIERVRSLERFIAEENGFDSCIIMGFQKYDND